MDPVQDAELGPNVRLRGGTGSWTPVCIGDESEATTTTTVAPVSAHLDVEGADSCSGETVTKETCLEAVQQLLPEGATQADSTLNDGSWSHVPQGCSMNHENYRALWNSQTDAISNTGSWTPVCIGDESEATTTTTVAPVSAHLDVEGADSCS